MDHETEMKFKERNFSFDPHLVLTIIKDGKNQVLLERHQRACLGQFYHQVWIKSLC